MRRWIKPIKKDAWMFTFDIHSIIHLISIMCIIMTQCTQLYIVTCSFIAVYLAIAMSTQHILQNLLITLISIAHWLVVHDV